jgi:hypothetical protein
VSGAVLVSRAAGTAREAEGWQTDSARQDAIRVFLRRHRSAPQRDASTGRDHSMRDPANLPSAQAVDVSALIQRMQSAVRHPRETQAVAKDARQV